MQSVFAPGSNGKRQAFDILVYDALGNPAESRVVTATEGEADVPDAHILHANFPNPFNPNTMITYELPEQGSVELAITNVYGQRIRTWSYSSRSAGTYSVSWDGRDNGGTSVATGVYFYRLTAGNFVQTRSMTLLR